MNLSKRHRQAINFSFFGSFVLGILFTILFYSKSIGLNLMIYTIILGSFLLSLKVLFFGLKKLNFFDLIAFVPSALAIASIFHQNTTILVFDVLFILLIIMPITYYSVFKDKLKNFSYLNSFLLYLNSVAGFIVALPKLFAGIFGISKYVHFENRKTTSIMISIFIGLILLIPLAGIFLALMASADVAFKNTITKVDLDLSLNQIFLTIFVTCAFIYLTSSIFISNYLELFVEPANKAKKGINTIVSTILLTGMNLIFILFNVVQLVYYYANHDKVADLGLTYSEYARQGFWQLQVVSIIAFIIVYIVSNYSFSVSPKAKVVTKTLMSLFIINILFVIYSAHNRMSLYESGYGLTELRLFPHLFMALEAVLFIYLLFANFSQKILQNFSLFSFVSIALFLLSLNIINPDKLIAKHNIEHFRSGELNELDTDYLMTLSSDAYLQLVDVDFSNKQEYYCTLYYKKAEMKAKNENIFEYNYSRDKAIKEITKITEANKCNY